MNYNHSRIHHNCNINTAVDKVHLKFAHHGIITEAWSGGGELFILLLTECIRVYNFESTYMTHRS